MSSPVKVIVTCALTGSAPTTARNPAVPVTPEQIGRSAAEAAAAGAAVVHVHVRDPLTAAPSSEVALYREALAEIGARASDLIVNLTTGPGGRFVPGPDDPKVAAPGTTLRLPDDRVAHVVALRPEMCSLDVATMNARDRVMMNVPDHIARMAARVVEAGVIPELEVFDLGHVRLANDMIARGLLPSPAVFQLCLGVPWGAPATPEAMIALKAMLPSGAHWFAFGVGSAQFPVVAQTVLLGGHVRVGLEDNLYLERGRLAASNGELVEKAVRIVRLLGGDIASPSEARAILGLPCPIPDN